MYQYSCQFVLVQRYGINNLLLTDFVTLEMVKFLTAEQLCAQSWWGTKSEQVKTLGHMPGHVLKLSRVWIAARFHNSTSVPWLGPNPLGSQHHVYM